MPLRLECFAESNVPVEVFGLTPDWARDRSPADVERFEILHGNRRLPLADLFRVSGDGADGRLEFSGELRAVHGIGAGAASGAIHVAGPAGRHVGAELRGGSIRVEGDAGDWLGAELRGGQIHVQGNAGDFVGAAYPGSPRGMTGGEILVTGNVGVEAAHSMRRGLLAVAGDCHDYPAVNMIAGSLFVFGRCGARPAAGMRRGTLALLGRDQPALLPTFRRAGRHCRPQFMALFLTALRRRGLQVPDELLAADFILHHGDRLTGGRGEVLTRRFD